MRHVLKVNKRSTRHCSGVFIVNFKYIWYVILVCFFDDFKHVNPDGKLYCLNWNLSIHFRVRSSQIRSSPVTFKIKFSMTRINISSQLLPIRYCIGLKLNIVPWSTKILKGMGRTLQVECSIEKIWKTSSRDPKNSFPEVFGIKFFTFNIK